MRKFKWIIPCMAFAVCVTTQAKAELRAASTDMQKCTSAAECTMVSQSCKTNCATMPLNSSYEQSYQEQRASICGGDMSGMPNCNVVPPLAAACINHRCTVDYAFKNNAGSGDLMNGGRVSAR